MSSKEIRRRKILSFVMKEAWKLSKTTILYKLSFSSALKIAWNIIKGYIRISHTKIVGVTYEARQKLLQKLSNYSKNQVVIKFTRQPDNSFDNMAICIIAEVRGKGKAHIGYLSRHLAAYLAPLIDSGKQIIVYHYDVTGGNSKRFGCNISYFIA